jgi:putative transposase
MKFEFMETHSKEFCIQKMAKVLGVCRSGYYEFIGRTLSKRSIENEKLIERLKEIFMASRGTYGSPRIHACLKKQGAHYSRKRIARLMQRGNIQAKMRKKWRGTPRSDKTTDMVAPNHLDQNFIVEVPNRVWISDITYVATREGWLYVAIVMDLFSRKVIGLSMGDKLETGLIMNALKQALYRRGIIGGLMHHSDRGTQYTSKEFRELVDRHGIKLSMSAKGYCYDNAVAESFFHTLKTEHTYHCDYKIREEAKNSIFEYVEVFYNRIRLHSTLGYVSPEDFENHWKNRISEEPARKII